MNEKWIQSFLEAGTKELGIDCSILVGVVGEIVRNAEKKEASWWRLAIVHLNSEQRKSVLETYKEIKKNFTIEVI